jgi:hypothetical protein
MPGHGDEGCDQQQSYMSPIIALPKSEIGATLFGNGEWARRPSGTWIFSPASTTQGVNSKAEANFLFESAVTH